MKWFIVIIFMEGLGSYIFFNPSFETLDECKFSANYPPHIQIYAQKMLQEYGKPRPVARVLCMDKEAVEDWIELEKKQREKEKGVNL